MKRLLLFWLSFFCLVNLSFAQENEIKGVVRSSTGIPLSSTTITNLNNKQISKSDDLGNFVINGSIGDTLQISRIGSKSVSVRVNQSFMEIELEEGDVLEQVVVTGYQTQRKADLTGAVSVVTMKDVQAPLTGNIMKSLQGRIPGVYISTNGSPDGGASVLVRGIGTLGNSSPLYIIDGMPSVKSTNELSNLDIESIQILKDASAASIYGSRAANGVIIITTKQGAVGKTTIDFRASSALKNYAKSLHWLNTEERGIVQWRAARNDGTDPNFGVYSFKDHKDASGNWVLDEVIIPEFIDAAKTMRAANTDWVEEIGRNSIVQNYNLTINSGNEKSKALVAFDYFSNDGTVKGTYFDRYSTRINTDFKLLNGKIVVGEHFSIVKTRRDVLGSTLDRTRNIQSIVPVRTVDGIGWGGPVSGMSDRHNPVRIIEDNKQNYGDMLRLFGDMYMEASLLKNLKFRSMLGMDYSFYWERNMQKTYKSGYMSEKVATLNNYHNRWGNFVWNNTLTYNLNLNNDHNLDFLVGQELLNYYSESLRAGRRGFTSEEPDYMYLNAGQSTQTNSGGGTAYRLLSYFGKVNYNFKDKYLASITSRYDGSSRFGKNNQYGLFPAFSLGWRLSEESFIKDNLSFLSDLKIRYGWGKTGNQEIGNFASFGMYEAVYATNPTWNPDNGTAYDISGSGTGSLPSGYRRIQQSNPDLRWEAAKQNNIGVDFGFLDQKLTGSIDYFNKYTDDILISPPFIATLGEGGNKWVNGASMENRGFEFLLSYSDRKGDFRYNVTGNLAGYRNKITKLPEDVINSYPGNGVDQTIINRPLRSFFGYIADGIFQNQTEVDEHAQQIGKRPGRIIYRDIDESGTVDDDDRTWLGNADPKFVYGLNFSLNYKAWDLGMFWNGVYGGLVNNGAKGFTDFVGFFSGENYGRRVLSAWTPENPNTDIPALSFNDLNNERRFSTYYIESNSYLKLRTIELGYTLQKNLLDQMKLKGLRFYVLGENILAFKKTWGKNKYTGVDPETPNSGYPIPFSITGGINLTF